jgi:hypothetical protein
MYIFSPLTGWRLGTYCILLFAKSLGLVWCGLVNSIFVSASFLIGSVRN